MLQSLKNKFIDLVRRRKMRFELDVRFQMVNKARYRFELFEKIADDANYYYWYGENTENPMEENFLSKPFRVEVEKDTILGDFMGYIESQTYGNYN